MTLPHLWSSEVIVERDDTDPGPLQFAQSPHRLTKTPGIIRWSGMSDEERLSLADKKVI